MAAKKLTTIISTLQASNFCLHVDDIKLFYSDFYQFSSMGLPIRKVFKISLKTPDTFYFIF